MAKEFKIDIGADGGTLEYTLSDPVGEPVDYLINGSPATDDQVDEWVRHWHELRNPVLCTCQWCTRAREARP